jgi:hypothetical protein
MQWWTQPFFRGATGSDQGRVDTCSPMPDPFKQAIGSIRVRDGYECTIFTYVVSPKKIYCFVFILNLWFTVTPTVLVLSSSWLSQFPNFHHLGRTIPRASRALLSPNTISHSPQEIRDLSIVSDGDNNEHLAFSMSLNIVTPNIKFQSCLLHHWRGYTSSLT